jgi:L-threonylcarbamoyladenylate synthase
MYSVVPEQDPSISDVDHAVSVLKNGGVIAYPTDTVYGLGADATNSEAVMRIREIKSRVDDKPILAMVADFAMLEEYAELTPLARAIAEEFLPGPLSLVLTSRDDRLAPVAGKDHAVGFRMPDTELCRVLPRAFGRPVTSTSLNKAGQPQPRTLQLMLEQLGDNQSLINLVIDEGELPMSSPSTVLDVRGEKAILLREGAVSANTLRRFL